MESTRCVVAPRQAVLWPWLRWAMPFAPRLDAIICDVLAARKETRNPAGVFVLSVAWGAKKMPRSMGKGAQPRPRGVEQWERVDGPQTGPGVR